MGGGQKPQFLKPGPKCGSPKHVGVVEVWWGEGNLETPIQEAQPKMTKQKVVGGRSLGVGDGANWMLSSPKTDTYKRKTTSAQAADKQPVVCQGG